MSWLADTRNDLTDVRQMRCTCWSAIKMPQLQPSIGSYVG